MESPWQLTGEPWENNVSAVRLTVFTGAGSRAPLKSYDFPDLWKILEETSFCGLETVHRAFIFVMIYNIGQASTTRNTYMSNLVISGKARET